MRIAKLGVVNFLLFIFIFNSCSPSKNIEVSSRTITISLDNYQFRLQADGTARIVPVENSSSYSSSFPFLQIYDSRGQVYPLTFLLNRTRIIEGSDSLPGTTRIEIPASMSDRLALILKFTLQKENPKILQAAFEIHNQSDRVFALNEIRFPQLQLDARDFGGKAPWEFWSFQGASYESRPDWILPLQPGFSRENFLGMNAPDYGGGIPVLDLWGRKGGIALSHLSSLPQRVAFPVQVEKEKGVWYFLRDRHPHRLAPGAIFRSLPVAIILHSGDYFNALVKYRSLMEKRGFKIEDFTPWAYEPAWCAWGYERDFTLSEIRGTLPKVKEVGFRWVTLDDGWQTANGDWNVRKDKYPGGEEGLKNFIKELHRQGFKVQLWWVPFDVAPNARLLKTHPNWVLINKEGKKQKISWWDTYYLCPAYPPVREYTRQLIHKFLAEWDLDGLKIDGQHQNAAPPCYNPAHRHQTPEESYQGTPEFFQMIYQEARKIKPEAVIQICPCGDVFNFYHMPYLNQPVASDPLSSWQIRLKGKTYKALMGPTVPYYGDHVELSDGGKDFASTFGIGGVPGSKFTWPLYPRLKNDTYLTPEKEKLFKKWLRLYQQLELSKGEYRNVYDMGWDNPEGHLIVKEGNYYYAFFARSPERGYSGQIELRGLDSGTYRVRDYWNERDYGTVEGPVGKLAVEFQRFLLLEARKDNKSPKKN